jgi:hypothetical protein
LANIAILIGNTEYQTLCDLECCGKDVLAIKELLEATNKFDTIELILNSDSSQLKERIRTAIDARKSIGEIFFYFTGHGYQHDAEFFFCATNFDAKRPNETGISNSELHTLLRASEADLVVKVIDACSSGALLVKSSDGSFIPTSKQGFKNLIQIASCLDSQNSLTGNPLSLFTDKFRAAALRKSDGIVYYTDIIEALRDEFLDNDNQTPHFVSQGTGREQFVEDAHRLDELRIKLFDETSKTEGSSGISSLITTTSSPLDVLERAEQKFVKKDTAKTFISQLFDKLIHKASQDDNNAEFFTSDIVVHSDYLEPTTRLFIIRVLSKEKRPDRFVTASITHEQRRRTSFGLAGLQEMMFPYPDDVVTHYELTLNCALDKAQLKITFTPKFVTLKQLILVVSCAPSLEACYVIEMLTLHSLRDWNDFDSEGEEVVRRWYKKSWTDDNDGLVDKIWEKLVETVQQNIDGAVKVLQG